MVKNCLILLITLVSFCRAVAQDTVVNVAYHGKLETIHSSILNQDRQVQVFIPPGYQPGSSQTYDVLYNLDGSDWNTGLIAQVQHFAETQDFMPPTIIVSIIEPDRNADLAPTHLTTWPHSGNAGKFLSFIKTELIPYINSHYPSNGDNTIWGHSLAGMFVLYAMINEPALFKSYIAMDPSVWWDDCYVIKMAADKLPTLSLQGTTFFIAGRDNDTTIMKQDSLHTVLSKNSPPGLKWKFVSYPQETHSSMRLKGTFDGLKFSYEGFVKNMFFGPTQGIVLKDSPYKLYYGQDTAHMHYTVDGTMPTLHSPEVLPAITVNGPAKVTYKVFTNRSRYDRVTTGNFSYEPMDKPLTAAPKNWRSGGFGYAYYEGNWEQFPDVSKLKPTQTGITDSSFEIGKLPRKDHYALVIDGLFESKEDGYYRFYLGNGDKDTKLYLDHKLLINFTEDGAFGQDAIVPLSKGFYPFRIEYLRKSNTSYELLWQYLLTPSIMESQNSILIPPSQEYGRR